MQSTIDRRPLISRSSFSTASLVESFLDPVIVIGLLFISAAVHGTEVDAAYILLGLLCFLLTFPGSRHLRESPTRMVVGTLMDWSLVAGLLLVFGFASDYIDFYPMPVVVTWMVAVPLALIGANLTMRRVLPRYLAMEGNQKHAIIVGCNESGVRLAGSFAQDPMLGVRMLGFFDDRTRDRLPGIGTNSLLGSLSDLADYVKLHRVDHIYLALPMASQPRILKLLDGLKDTTTSIFFVPDIFVTDLIQGRMDTIHGVPVVAVCETPFTGFNGVLKRGSDIVLSALILAMISPVLVACAIGVKRSSPGPLIFKQRRYGLDGKEIIVYKFRSMSVCEDGSVVTQAKKGDQRVTPFGAFIRRTSLDELPQFVNVLQGRMSIVGPRPHAVAHNEMYRKLIKGYMVRHKVKPGITGWAQVNGARGETETVEKMEERIAFDLEYLRNWSLALDIRIILKTVLVAFNDRHAY
ncbi:undecaprenyl-phosphate glucose phosphotransferase [Uliginosibacterium sp. H1]|uniref:undecaprenyl-phosphate glucose phosphotransferase n=1 Tax=Uliginosibacterium sp. H1 TaxID=3114757 RepID=UPI002E17787C|nr:undecaprenyl-phosphate glucose phosphotransferase [Uliginosibacterium sp. H1]